MKGFIFICGNDGTGKSTVALKLNGLRPDYLVIERSLPGLKKEWKDLIDIIDNATLEYTFDHRPSIPDTIIHEGKEYPIYWIMLDAPVEIIEQRIAKRTNRGIWETPKVLGYFRERLKELSAYYGIPLIDTSKFAIDDEINEILRIIESGDYREIRAINAEKLTYDLITKHNVESAIIKALSEEVVQKFDVGKFVYGDEFMDDELTKTAKENLEFKKRLLARWLVKDNTPITTTESLKFEKEGISISLDKGLYFKQYTEGESKKVFQIITNNPYLKPLVIIILKSTIYSHSKQATGEIEGLGQIRSKGTSIFMEMMWRNQLKHTYRSVNSFGVIIAEFVDTKPIEVVFKKYCEGTDKHSYYGMTSDRSVVLETGEYRSGPYIRFDWRNPNHISVKTGTNVILNPYYYLLEEHYGKEKFFEAFLKDGKRAKPFGDRAVYSDILGEVIDIPKTRESAIKMYCTIQSYFSEVGLEAKDGCFMLDKTGTTFWSEINQDCLRIQAKAGQESLDKDIWRAGGSAAKDQVVKKWLAFNSIMIDYFKAHRFIDTEMKHYSYYIYQSEVNRILSDKRLTLTPTYSAIYQKLRYQNDHRAVVLTLDLYNEKPSLVKSGVVSEVHSDGDVIKAFRQISIYPDVLVVDLNGAFGESKNNRAIIKSLAKSDYIYAGGGIRTLEDVQDVLESSARRVVISSNTDESFVNSIPKSRLIVELTVDENNNVLIHGRKTNTKVEIIDKINELLKLGIDVVSITFHRAEGHLEGLPREQIAKIMARMPDTIKKVIIAGGISTLADLEFLWSFRKVVPQLGSAIWRGKISLGDLYVAMTRFDGNGLVMAVIQDMHGIVKGLVWLNAEAIRKTCETRLLHRYSRKAQEVQCKGATSGNYHRVKQISLDCDSDAMLITVETDKPFCHTGSFSCFRIQSIIKANLSTLINHIKSHKDKPTYSGQMQRHSGLALAKMMEEYWEIACATKKSQVLECSDFLVHFLMYLNSLDLNFDDLLNELNARRWNPHIIRTSSSKHKKLNGRIVIGITSEKYFQFPDQFAKDTLGFEIVRPKGRCLKITYNVTDKEKYDKLFAGKTLLLVPIRPRDMNMMMAFGTVDYVITYNTVVVNNPLVYTNIVEVPIHNIRLALLKKKGEIIDPSQWSPTKKAVIATEYVNDVHDFLVDIKKIPEDAFSLVHIAGASESFIVNDTRTNYILCDAIVETGDTVKENNLEIWEIIRDYGSIKIGLYKAIN